MSALTAALRGHATVHASAAACRFFPTTFLFVGKSGMAGGCSEVERSGDTKRSCERSRLSQRKNDYYEWVTGTLLYLRVGLTVNTVYTVYTIQYIGVYRVIVCTVH